MESLKDLPPAKLNSYTLILINEEIYTHFDEFNAWLDNLTKQSEYFKKIEKLLKICYTYIVEDSISYITSLQGYKKLGHFSARFYMKNLINYLEIFLNELRKSAFANGLYDDPKVLSGEKVF